MGAHRGLKRALNPLEQELQEIVNCPVWVLGTVQCGCWELDASPLKAAGALGAESSLQSFIKDFFKELRIEMLNAPKSSQIKLKDKLETKENLQ